jgi:Spy/CpxP family protein refolding chaperone
MKNKSVNTGLAGIIVFLLLTGFQANAQRGGGYGQGRWIGDGPGPMNRMETMLDLSDEQETQIEKVHLDFQKETLTVWNKIREKSAQLNTLITEGADKNKIDQLVDEMGDLRTEVNKARISTHLKVRELLTDEQKVKFDNHFANRSGMPGYRGGMRWPGRGWN